MSIQTFYSETYLTCDCCEKEVKFDSFYDAVDGKKEIGWISRKNVRDDWEDVCDECKKTLDLKERVNCEKSIN